METKIVGIIKLNYGHEFMLKNEMIDLDKYCSQLEQLKAVIDKKNISV